MNASRLSLTTILLLATLTSLRAHPAPQNASRPLGQTGQWEPKPAFSDEFDGAEVDARKWTTKVASWGPWTWDEKNAVQRDGKLVLSMTYEAHARKPNQYWHLPMNLILSLGLRHPHIGWVGQDMKPQPKAATAEGFPTSMEVDYVRVWERKP